MEKLKEDLKSRLRLMGIATLFLMGTTFASLILICVPTWISPNISLKEIDWGSSILGSIMGQVTLLIAISLRGKIGKAMERIREDINDEVKAYAKGD